MIAFLILHYKNEKETIACVESIQNLYAMQHEIEIVIVDNGSQNGSTEILHQKYVEDERIKIIDVPENMGFSGGNNVGFSALKKYHNLEFLVVCNSDVIFIQNDFIEKIQDNYEQTQFDILGPDIYKVQKDKKKSTSPLYKRIANLTVLDDTEQVFRTRLSAIEAGEKSWEKIKMTYPSMKIGIRYGLFCVLKKVYEVGNNWFPRQKENVILQGACLIFSAHYMAVHEKLFEPETFLYYEEAILYARAQMEGLKLVYAPSLKVWHKEGGSTNVEQGRIERYEKHLVNRLAAIKICKEYIGANQSEQTR